MTPQVVVRFAPSPTGYLHIGGARTAIFNWLFARKVGGKFILRIEDTDAERSTAESIQGIIDGLQWLGLDWDEGPCFQSRFIKDHQAAAQKLLQTDQAYKCFCSKRDLEQKREQAQRDKVTWRYDGTCRNLTPDEIATKVSAGQPYTIRLKVPHGPGGVIFEDVVYGLIEKKYEDLEDFVIVRSNGQPLYVLSNAVDDMRDGVTHIIRGQDGLANVPKQILIYRALGAPLPRFAHMSLALDSQKAKISKRRHGERVSVDYYKDNGFLPWAMVNFLVLYGWSRPGEEDIFSKEELIQAFSLEGISRNNPIFDLRKDDPKFFTDPKAVSINAHYLRTMAVEDLVPYVQAELQKSGLWNPAFEKDRRRWFLDTIDLIRTRFNLTTDFATLGRAYFSDEFPIDQKALKNNLIAHPELKHWLTHLADRIDSLKAYTAKTLERTIRDMIKEGDIKPGTLVNGIRTVLTGQSVGPDFLEVLLILGKQTVVKRLSDVESFITQERRAKHEPRFF
ncbi:MAG: glutamate--tRNA ligase [Desulfobacterales bacterium]|jgi:glutamyl-tRNA synthetase